MEEGEPNRKCKGRVVFRGNNVGNTSYGFAIFQYRSGNPTMLEPAKAVGLVSIFPGSVGGQADATALGCRLASRIVSL